MYYDLKFPYRISAEAGLAHDGEGNNVEAVSSNKNRQL